MTVDGARKHIFIEASDELIGGVGEVSGDFLFDGALLVGPFSLRILNVLHAGGVDAQSDVEVGCGDRHVILGDILLSVGVIGASELGVDRGNLVRSDSGAASEGHMFLGVRHAGKARGRFVPANQIILLDGDDRSERIANDDHAQAVIQGGAGDVGGCRRFLLGEQQRCGENDYGNGSKLR